MGKAKKNRKNLQATKLRQPLESKNTNVTGGKDKQLPWQYAFTIGKGCQYGSSW